MASLEARPDLTGNRYQAMNILVGRWVELDPKAAEEETQKNKPGMEGNVLVGDVDQSLAARDASDAWTKAQALPAGPSAMRPRKASLPGWRRVTPMAR